MMFSWSQICPVSTARTSRSACSRRSARISSERRSESSETGEAGQIVRQERAFGYMNRIVPLPHEVTAENSRATFTNGVLELRLKKSMVERGERIPVE